MAAKDIEKLKEKFDKDPNSKLFLPLAEEYRKEGMLEEAIDVLQKGLEKHVTYTSARVLLGKTYLEKGMMDESRKEFESVIKIVPDNLFAHKKLAELYRDTGETDLAIKAFKTVLKLNPMDEESISHLKDIEAALSPAPPAEEVRKADSSYGEIRMPGAAVPAAEEQSEIGRAHV
jgi:tetratricopeptide (TPR) repeat protein